MLTSSLLFLSKRAEVSIIYMFTFLVSLRHHCLHHGQCRCPYYESRRVEDGDRCDCGGVLCDCWLAPCLDFISRIWVGQPQSFKGKQVKNPCNLRRIIFLVFGHVAMIAGMLDPSILGYQAPHAMDMNQVMPLDHSAHGH